MRVVFDTNVLVSALLFEESMPAQAFFFAVARGVVLISAELVNELQRVIYRPKFDRYIADSQREDFILSLVETSELVVVAETINICRDPKDNMILELAVSGDADMIVTGDDDLLVLNSFQEITILNPQEFLESFSFDK
ncbi:MAG: putative toxin-antitoxin system toxin component, PIN family protein [Anaerolineaceae bacterium]|nr:putative toxin-antitoxin system toxin component, PIN family [Anaerolineales bacterium]MDL1926492.1 putative toxin-antitoxin system toxin component, PIN family [Anaerolineae bacterium AMX1]GIK09441.1 MAG: putative toxin-antitoxin system toxin component, PIN family protein [Chloroflexota bacterium]GJQ39039.1 MAG: putative toxin-antitoxin system toxin component, PIN family protein [Anaerolineaceae bacterium]WKZ54501.1 MAG: putative toxin-antitoxin system toxin component, PIN family [Anaerolinea